ncbi:MFS transporter [Corynebacterium guangdongense]|uniref:MFS family permease n=1 Tax=Corynebacterium guangdongense TaxID=1783348 RepID=A0ABU2A0F8_9CORY|nr:MFS transporter [Corynebacterium guangdongense]MDR7330660.1 MFS family permease [Corynebacterium guangdongense]WJZ16676.1 multidrug efflux system protein MdtL [Corynebacterium guangdongense]
MSTRVSHQRVFVSVLLLLLGAGWAANHFASLLGPLRDWQELSGVTVNAAFGIYALGLLPSLLGGGALVDRVGARGVVLTGATLAAVGNTSLLFWHDEIGVLVGRFIVGLGVGLTTSAGTVWAGQIRPNGGAVLAGIFLTSGFAVGPVFSGAIIYLIPERFSLPAAFALTVTFSLLTIALALLVGNATSPAAPRQAARARVDVPYRTLGRALAAALPMAVWVFSTVTTAVVILSARAQAGAVPALLVPGLAALLSFGSGLLIQVISRRLAWGPGAGVAGALLAGAGMGLAALGGASLPLPLFVPACMVLGCAYGLSLQQGLLDVSYLAPARSHGIAVGIFYVAAYLGFGLPVIMELLLPLAGARSPFLVLSLLALVSALIRSAQIVRTDLLVRTNIRKP